MSKTIKIAIHGMSEGADAAVLASFSYEIQGQTFNFAVTRPLTSTRGAALTHVESGMLAAAHVSDTVRAPKGGWESAGRAALLKRVLKIGPARVRSALAAHTLKTT